MAKQNFFLKALHIYKGGSLLFHNRCNENNHQGTKAQRFTKRFIIKKTLVSWCLGGKVFMVFGCGPLMSVQSVESKECG